jgi:hypothetical protein
MVDGLDPTDPTKLAPVCTSELGAGSGVAYPAVRFVSLAQEWGKDAYVDSICKGDWRDAFRVIAGHLSEHLHKEYACIDDAPSFDGRTCTAACWMIETLDDGRACPDDPTCPQSWCLPASPRDVNRLEPCRDPSSGATCVPLKRDLGVVTLGGFEHRQCLVRQVPRDPTAFRCGEPLGAGWYYLPPAWSAHACHEVAFATTSTDPLLPLGSSAVLRCPR